MKFQICPKFGGKYYAVGIEGVGGGVGGIDRMTVPILKMVVCVSRTSVQKLLCGFFVFLCGCLKTLCVSLWRVKNSSCFFVASSCFFVALKNTKKNEEKYKFQPKYLKN